MDRLRVVTGWIIAAAWTASVVIRLTPLGKTIDVPASVDLGWTALVGILFAPSLIRRGNGRAHS